MQLLQNYYSTISIWLPFFFHPIHDEYNVQMFQLIKCTISFQLQFRSPFGKYIIPAPIGTNNIHPIMLLSIGSHDSRNDRTLCWTRTCSFHPTSWNLSRVCHFIWKSRYNTLTYLLLHSSSTLLKQTWIGMLSVWYAHGAAEKMAK